MNARDRAWFDGLLEDVLRALPAPLHELLDEAPLIVEDHADPALMREMGLDPDVDVLCGLHSGTPLTERSVTEIDGPETICVFREGVIEEAGGWSAGDDEVRKEIRITLLHEIGHHFGLDEDDLERLGYA